ncbi:putative PDZ domain-containing protein [Helianthus anomalus]
MLVVDSVVPGGPAHKLLEPGDVLVRMNKEVTTQFLKMESLLDDSVDQNVELELERGGKPFTVQLPVSYFNFWIPCYYVNYWDPPIFVNSLQGG